MQKKKKKIKNSPLETSSSGSVRHASSSEGCGKPLLESGTMMISGLGLLVSVPFGSQDGPVGSGSSCDKGGHGIGVLVAVAHAHAGPSSLGLIGKIEFQVTPRRSTSFTHG